MQNNFPDRNFHPQPGMQPMPKEKRRGHFANKPASHGGGAALLSWIGAGLFVVGIAVGAATAGVGLYVLGGLAVQCWIVAIIIKPIEAIWTLLNERLPSRPTQQLSGPTR